MKINSLIIPFAVTLSLAACTSPKGTESPADTVVNGDTVAKSMDVEAASTCYLRTDGKDNKDTTSIELLIKDSKVTGQMYWHPFEKDSRKGTLSGVSKGDTVNVVWTFMQEGMKDTLGLQFLIQGDNLTQKPLKLNTKTGREQTDNIAGYTLLHHPSVSLKK